MSDDEIKAVLAHYRQEDDPGKIYWEDIWKLCGIIDELLKRKEADQ